MIAAAETARFSRALPYWVSLLLVPLVALAALRGGWTLLLPPAGAWWLYILLDAAAGQNHDNPDPDTPEPGLLWYRVVTWIWLPVQIAMIYGSILVAVRGGGLAGWEQVGLMLGVGVLSGAIGIVYAHELMHQPGRGERWLATEGWAANAELVAWAASAARQAETVPITVRADRRQRPSRVEPWPLARALWQARGRLVAPPRSAPARDRQPRPPARAKEPVT